MTRGSVGREFDVVVVALVVAAIYGRQSFYLLHSNCAYERVFMCVCVLLCVHTHKHARKRAALRFPTFHYFALSLDF